MQRTVLSAAILLLLISQQDALSQIPRTISFQGVLTDTLGVPKPDGTYSITFRLYESSSGGSAIWTEQTRAGRSR